MLSCKEIPIESRNKIYSINDKKFELRNKLYKHKIEEPQIVTILKNKREQQKNDKNNMPNSDNLTMN